eukprot:365312-Chlamydomonas_euryale.AAC.7
MGGLVGGCLSWSKCGTCHLSIPSPTQTCVPGRTHASRGRRNGLPARRRHCSRPPAGRSIGLQPVDPPPQRVHLAHERVQLRQAALQEGDS